MHTHHMSTKKGQRNKKKFFWMCSVMLGFVKNNCTFYTSIKYISSVKMFQKSNSIFQCIIALWNFYDATYIVVLNFEGWYKSWMKSNYHEFFEIRMKHCLIQLSNNYFYCSFFWILIWNLALRKHRFILLKIHWSTIL